MNTLMKERVLLVLALLLCLATVLLAVWEAPDLSPMGVVYSDAAQTEGAAWSDAAGSTAQAASSAPAGTSAAQTTPPQTSGASAAPPAADGRLDLNTATLEQLMELPGIGEVLAERVLEYRETHGGFSSVEELMNVSGIGEKRFAALKDLVTVS